MNRTYLRGDMYYADLGRGIGSEQEGYRPVLILQNNTGNKYSPTVIVAAISSKVDAKAKLPTHYLLQAENGLELPSLVLLEQLRTIDKKRLGAYIGHLEEKHIRKINHALAVSVGLNGVWLAMAAELCVRGLIFMVRLYRGRWLNIDLFQTKKS